MENINMDQTLNNLNDALKAVLAANMPESQEVHKFLEFRNDLDGKGIIWSGQGYTKQLVFYQNPDRLFSSEHINLARGKSISINEIKIIDEKELGSTITKSSLRELGHLNGLIVDGSVSIGQYLIFDSHTNRLGLGTEQPNSAVSIVENGCEIVLGSKDSQTSFIGTYTNNNLDLGTGNQARISLHANGNIVIGNPSTGYSKIALMGLVSVNTVNPDPRAALHVNGAVKFNDRLHLLQTTPPNSGSFAQGDIVWNESPKVGHFVGWICTQTGNPGLWNGFGRIE